MTDVRNKKYETVSNPEFVPVYYIEDDYESSDSDIQVLESTIGSMKSEESVLDFKEITYFNQNSNNINTSTFLPFNLTSNPPLRLAPTFKPKSPSKSTFRRTFRRASSIKNIIENIF